MNKEQEIQDSAQDAIAHAQLIGLPIGAEVDRMIAQLKTAVVAEGIDPASVLSTVEDLYEQLLTELVSQTIQRAKEIVQRYIATTSEGETQEIARKTIAGLRIIANLTEIESEPFTWDKKAIAALKELQITGALKLLEIKLKEGIIQTQQDHDFVNSILTGVPPLSDEQPSDLQILEVFPKAALEVRYLERLDEIFSSPS